MNIEAVFNHTVAPGAEGRLDHYLAKEIPEYSRSLYSRLIKEGLILVNDRAVKPSSKIKPGTLVSITIPKPRVPEIIAEPIPLDVIHEDESLIIINKSSDMVVHPAYGHERGTLVNALLHRSNTLSTLNGPERPGIVHRLDRETSGIIIVARNDHAHKSLSTQFQERLVKKEYLTIVTGELQINEGIVDAPIGRSLADRKKMAVRHDSGRDSLTRYRREQPFQGFTLVRCFPKTGRTHQIRIHMRALGFPVLCDKTYSRRKALYESELMGKKKRIPGEVPLIERQALHATAIRFTHPATNKEVHFEQAVPDDFRRTLDSLEKHRPAQGPVQE